MNDYIRKEDVLKLLEETKRELTKDVDRKSAPYLFVSSVIGILKCKINMMGEKTDDR